MISDETSNLSSIQPEESENSVDKIDDEAMNLISNIEDENEIKKDHDDNQIVDENSSLVDVQGNDSTSCSSNVNPKPETNDLISKKELESIRISYEDKLKQQQLESTRKENMLIMRLTIKEQELQECLGQIESLKKLDRPSISHMESLYLDPALNYIFEKMKKEVDMSKSRVEEMQNEMKAWKFNSDSISGKQLMAKCKQLHQENEELGKMISSGKIAKLESGLAMEKNYAESLIKSHADMEEVLYELEENVEGLQNTVYYMQQNLKQMKDRNEQLEKIIENCGGQCKNELDSIANNNDGDEKNDNQQQQQMVTD
ncbi:pre-mRNA-splicing regulator WTAP-like [Dermatophagoides pteronyssinus]|uniref:pre-mRNA-splicing regulator WTAP-like n=1 Tax=Dermatophagoides pteronyssinus TaxID=6956 RepID=UPI003F6629CA